MGRSRQEHDHHWRNGIESTDHAYRNYRQAGLRHHRATTCTNRDNGLGNNEGTVASDHQRFGYHIGEWRRRCTNPQPCTSTATACDATHNDSASNNGTNNNRSNNNQSDHDDRGDHNHSGHGARHAAANNSCHHDNSGDHDYQTGNNHDSSGVDDRTRYRSPRIRVTLPFATLRERME